MVAVVVLCVYVEGEERGRLRVCVCVCVCVRGGGTILLTLETFTLIFQISLKTASYCFKTDYFVIQMPQNNNKNIFFEGVCYGNSKNYLSTTK